MPVYPISPEQLDRALSAVPAEAPVSALACSPELRIWCAQLEAGGILYFPQTPVPIPADDLQFLIGQKQTGSALHKNIAYKPAADRLSGVGKSASHTEAAHLHAVMRRYSDSIDAFLTRFLAPYQRHWRLDYASFRPIEEQGRDLPTRRRNDLLHTDAFPTRPTRGARILRFFHNIHPTRTRDWVVGEPFARVVKVFAPSKLPVPRPDGVVSRTVKLAGRAAGLGRLVPQLKRTPYDEFMMQLHNAMKEDPAFQTTCLRESFQFPAGSSWMVYTETVPHAVLAGQYALEQTFLIDPAAMVTPDSAPVRILESLAGAKLV
ncbi:MAG TPA: Kdo hydroxylase family protein [Terracidiphilus sp.]|nr:Kdo hydroxylase family protein [Terracidiphilus sp.]